MKDRVPGAPGQYRATVSAEEFAKLQNGEAFTITMVRDDKPLTEGTPYSKAAVLPDSVANAICPDIQDPSPADAFAGLLPLRGGTMTGKLNLTEALSIESGGTGAKTAAQALMNLGAASMEVIWQNADTTSAFPAQTLPLDLSSYSGVLILPMYATAGRRRIPPLYSPMSSTGGFIGFAQPDNKMICGRMVTNISATGITFGTGRLYTIGDAETVENNTYAIPAVIYGIKGVIV